MNGSPDRSTFPDPGLAPRLTLVTGGARSGKSAHAEALARATALPRRYIATAQAFDDEMAARIARHRADRGEGWLTIEAPLDLGPALAGGAGTVTLVDCLTLWLTNHLLAGHDLAAKSLQLMDDLSQAPGPVILVTNEVGWGIVPDNALSRAFRDEAGRLNQRVAAHADRVVAVISGLPLMLKGTA
jgi:adenosylcobinamide kinase / adenosylcobinamide-phosphate guanylyltransferase